MFNSNMEPASTWHFCPSHPGELGTNRMPFCKHVSNKLYAYKNLQHHVHKHSFHRKDQ